MLKYIFFNFKLILVSLVFVIITFQFSLVILAQESLTAPVDINLAITKVVKDDVDLQTTVSSEKSWTVAESLKINDAIKYQWKGTNIGVYFEKNPAICCGFIRVYIDNENIAENFVATTGSDDYPFKLSKIATRLKPGKNKLIFVFFNHTNKPTTNKASITFNYETDSPKPKITVNKPTVGALFAKDIPQEISLELENFKLSNLTDPKSQNIGKLNIYGNTKENLLTTINNSIEISDGKARVDIKPELIPGFEKLADSKTTKLIFQLVPTAEGSTLLETTVEVITNYTNTIDAGYPKISIADPNKTAGVTEITADRIIKLKIDNFEIIPKPPLNNKQIQDSKKGYLQIFVDNKPLQTTWTKSEFTLKEIGYISTESGEKEIKVQLVNQNYEKLLPEATDKIKVQYNSPTFGIFQNNQEDTKQSGSNWKLIIIILTIILIVGGILISITKS